MKVYIRTDCECDASMSCVVELIVSHIVANDSWQFLNSRPSRRRGIVDGCICLSVDYNATKFKEYIVLFKEVNVTFTFHSTENKYCLKSSSKSCNLLLTKYWLTFLFRISFPQISGSTAEVENSSCMKWN